MGRVPGRGSAPPCAVRAPVPASFPLCSWQSGPENNVENLRPGLRCGRFLFISRGAEQCHNCCSVGLCPPGGPESCQAAGQRSCRGGAARQLRALSRLLPRGLGPARSGSQVRTRPEAAGRLRSAVTQVQGGGCGCAGRGISRSPAGLTGSGGLARDEDYGTGNTGAVSAEGIITCTTLTRSGEGVSGVQPEEACRENNFKSVSYR